MTNHPDAVSLLDTLLRDRGEDPFDPDATAAQASLERILAAPPSAPPPRRTPRPARRAVVVALGAVIAVAAVALSPSGSSDVIARAGAAVNEPGAILHLEAQIRQRDSAAELRDGAPDASVDRTIEVWQTAGARQERVTDGTGGEYVVDWDARTVLSYNAQLDELIRNADPGFFDPYHRVPAGTDAPTPANVNAMDDLARLLQRARDGDAGIHLLGQSTVRGIPVYELRVDYTLPRTIAPAGGTITDPRGLPTAPVKLSRLVYVGRDDYLPVRITELGPAGVVSSITDYTTAERLPVTPENERLLRMAPHPGAEHIVTGAPAGPAQP